MRNELDRVRAGRIAAVAKYPYLSAALMALVLKPIKGLKTFGVTKYFVCYYDPQLKWLDDIEVVADVLRHEIWHLLRNHSHVAEKLLGITADDKGRNQVFNIAADCEINDSGFDLERLKKASGVDVCHPDKFGLEKDKYVLHYYRKLMEQKDGQGQGDVELQVAMDNQAKAQGPGSGSCGSCASNAKSKAEKAVDEKIKNDAQQGEGGEGKGTGNVKDISDGFNEEEGVSEAEAEMIRRHVAKDIQQHLKDRGTVPGVASRFVDSILSPKVHWTKELSGAVRTAVAEVSGRVDYTYKRPSRRQSAYGRVIIPSMIQPLPKVSIIVDTSGSMSSDDLIRCASEVKGVLTSVGSAWHGVDLYAVDAAVANKQKIKNIKELELKGGGGTDMRVGIREAMKDKPDIVIVMTDGYTPWPREKPKNVSKIVALLVGSSSDTTPQWMRSIEVIDDEELV